MIMVKIGVQPLRLHTLRDSSQLGCQTVVKKKWKDVGKPDTDAIADPNMLQDFMLIVTSSDI